MTKNILKNMKKNRTKVIVTGGCGFIGSEFVRQTYDIFDLYVLDIFSYAADICRLESKKNKCKIYNIDICDKDRLRDIMFQIKPDIVVHFGAESHVDNSLNNCGKFFDTNIFGTKNLLDLSLKLNIEKFIHVSTDEVFGSILNGSFTEEDNFHPNNPYAVSKACGDWVVQTYYKTYGLPSIVIRPCNNYGIWQHPEKFLPKVFYRLFTHQNITLHGDGKHKREWMSIDDTVSAILLLMEKSKLGTTYNISTNHELSNINLVQKIMNLYPKTQSLITYIKDRTDNDKRYSLNCDKIKELGFVPKHNIEEDLEFLLNWYYKHLDWLRIRVG